MNNFPDLIFSKDFVFAEPEEDEYDDPYPRS